MPRPVKCRKVCHFPQILEFLPADDTEKKTPIVLTVDEYETIRLLDKKGYSQEQCAESMQIARTTVQRIYEIARKKIADALIDGHPLKIEGGVQFTDEPTGNLDSATSHEVLGLLKMAARQFSQTIILITHDRDIAQLADRIVHIEDGKIVGNTGKGSELHA